VRSLRQCAELQASMSRPINVVVRVIPACIVRSLERLAMARCPGRMNNQAVVQDGEQPGARFSASPGPQRIQRAVEARSSASVSHQVVRGRVVARHSGAALDLRAFEEARRPAHEGRPGRPTGPTRRSSGRSGTPRPPRCMSPRYST
jgi:hypothetical protein